MTTVFVEAQANGPPRNNPGSGTNGRTPGTYANTSQATAVLNRMGLPNDVRRRYDTRDKPLTPSRVLPFTNGDYFYHNQAIGTGKFLSIVITGHVLFHDYQSKSFQKAVPKCLTDDMAHLRMYYAELYVKCLDHGIYIPHYFLLRHAPITRTSGSGFEFGTGKDLPPQLEIRLSSWSHDVLYALRHAFSDTSRFHKIAYMENDGYQALQVIFSENHPNIAQIPDLLVDTTPRQRQNESMHQFWMRFIDHKKIKSWIEDCRYDMLDQRTVKTFIAKCYYSNFLLRETAEEMKIKTIFETQFLGSRLPVTLQNIIDTANSRETFARPLRPDEFSTNGSIFGDSGTRRSSSDRNGSFPDRRFASSQNRNPRGGYTSGRGGRGYNGGRYNSGRNTSNYNDRNSGSTNTDYPIRQQLLEYGDMNPSSDDHIIDDDMIDDDDPEDSSEPVMIHAVYRNAGNAQRFQKSCILCSSTEHLIHKCPALNERDATQLLRLQLQSAQLLDKVQKQARTKKIPIQETKLQLLPDDSAPESPTSSDFQEGSS
jgi:hypothetical protein